jgi:hypothetical protein
VLANTQLIMLLHLFLLRRNRCVLLGLLQSLRMRLRADIPAPIFTYQDAGIINHRVEKELCLPPKY